MLEQNGNCTLEQNLHFSKLLFFVVSFFL